MLDSIKGEVTIFGNSFGKKVSYSMSISTKKEDKYISVWVPVSFSKKCNINDLESRFDIKIKDSWFQVYESTKDGPKLKLFVNDCDIITTKKTAGEKVLDEVALYDMSPEEFAEWKKTKGAKK